MRGMGTEISDRQPAVCVGARLSDPPSFSAELDFVGRCWSPGHRKLCLFILFATNVEVF